MEYDAARDVAMRLSEGAPWTEQDANTPTPYLLGAHRLASGRTLSVALARPTRMGGPATMPIMAAPVGGARAPPPGRGGPATMPIRAALVERLKPHCLAMSGLCAGNPADVALGD